MCAIIARYRRLQGWIGQIRLTEFLVLNRSTEQT